MAEQQPVVKKKIPPIPPPKPKRIFTETGESFLVYNQIYNPPAEASAQPREQPLISPSPREARPPNQTVPLLPDQTYEKYVSMTPHSSRMYSNIGSPPLPPMRTSSVKTPKEKLSRSPVSESTPKKGIIRHAYSRAKEFFIGKKESPRKSPRRTPLPISLPIITPDKQGAFRKLLMSDTPNKDQTASSTSYSSGSYSENSGDQESSRLGDSSAGTSRSTGYSSDVSVSYLSEASGGRSSATIQGLMRSPETSSEVSDSDLENEDGYARIGRRVNEVMSIRVNAPANIRVATSEQGEVTTCIKTGKDRQKDA